MPRRQPRTRLHRSLNRTTGALVVGGLCMGLSEGKPQQQDGEARVARTVERAVLQEQVRWRRQAWYRQPAPWSAKAERGGHGITRSSRL